MRGAPEARAEPATFEACYAEHRDAVYRLCLRYGAGRSSFAEDVTQETFVRLFQSFAKLDRERPISDWLYAVASRLCISRLRRDRSMLGWLSRLVHRAPDRTPSAAQLYEHHEAAAELMAAIGRLPPKQQVALCMKAIDGKSQKEIARVLRVSEGYVSQLITRARQALTDRGWENVE
jgi:RNA polymerase sigma factor (sigma-70 family)